MPKDFVQPAKNRPALPKRVPQVALDMATTKLDATVGFDFLEGDVERQYTKCLYANQQAYLKACKELELEPTPREEVTL